MADRYTGQGGDPAQSRMGLELVNLRLGQHPTISHQHHARQAELLPQLLDLISYGGRIPRVTRINLDRNGTPFAIGHHSVHNNGPSLFSIPVVTKLCQRTGAAFVVAAADVV